jgi:hypothetical protein
LQHHAGFVAVENVIFVKNLPVSYNVFFGFVSQNLIFFQFLRQFSNSLCLFVNLLNPFA